MKTTRLHITLVAIPLLDEFECNKAISIFQEFKSSVLKPILDKLKSELKVQLVGVHCMQSDPAKAHVVYAKVENEVLQEIANKITAVFASEGDLFSNYFKSFIFKK